MSQKLHDLTNSLTDQCLPWRNRKVRSCDDPWITDDIKRAIRRRKKRYKKRHRGSKWKDVKAETDELIKN